MGMIPCIGTTASHDVDEEREALILWQLESSKYGKLPHNIASPPQGQNPTSARATG